MWEGSQAGTSQDDIPFWNEFLKIPINNCVKVRDERADTAEITN